MQRILEVCVKSYPADLAQYPPWLLIFNNPFDADSLRALPDELLGEALAAIFAAAARRFEPADELIALGESLLAGNRCADALRYYLAEQALLRGEPEKAREYLIRNRRITAKPCAAGWHSWTARMRKPSSIARPR